jgi:hypothetical protein
MLDVFRNCGERANQCGPHICFQVPWSAQVPTHCNIDNLILSGDLLFNPLRIFLLLIEGLGQTLFTPAPNSLPALSSLPVFDRPEISCVLQVGMYLAHWGFLFSLLSLLPLLLKRISFAPLLEEMLKGANEVCQQRVTNCHKYCLKVYGFCLDC